MGCTAAERQDSNGPVYGDYMDVMESTVFNESTANRRVVVLDGPMCFLGMPDRPITNSENRLLHISRQLF